jgi:hypothetical protein
VFDAIDVAELAIDLLKFPFRRILALGAAVHSFATGGAGGGGASSGGEGSSHVDPPTSIPLVRMLREAYVGHGVPCWSHCPSVRVTSLFHSSPPQVQPSCGHGGALECGAGHAPSSHRILSQPCGQRPADKVGGRVLQAVECVIVISRLLTSAPPTLLAAV